MEQKAYAVVNRTNNLPVLAFSMSLPNTEEPPPKRGLRLLAEKMIDQYRVNPDSLPFQSEDDITSKIPEMYTVRELPMGISITD